jgi:hypothetical protein
MSRPPFVAAPHATATHLQQRNWHEHKPVYFNTFEQADGSKKVLLTS